MKRFTSGLAIGLFFSAIFALAQGERSQQGSGVIIGGNGGSVAINSGGFTVTATSLAQISADIGMIITAGTGAGAAADLSLTADDNVNISAPGDQVLVTTDLLNVNATGQINLNTTDDVVRLTATTTNSTISLNDAGGIETVLLRATGAGNSVQIVSGDRIFLQSSDGVELPNETQATLPTPVNGAMLFCSDCNQDATCTAGGAGAFAFRIAGAWTCELN